MLDKLKKFLCRHSQTSIALWMVVGGYLIYLAWDIYKTKDSIADPTLMAIAMAVFTLVGLVILAVGGLALFGGYNKETAEKNQQEQEKED